MEVTGKPLSDAEKKAEQEAWDKLVGANTGSAVVDDFLIVLDDNAKAEPEGSTGQESIFEAAHTKADTSAQQEVKEAQDEASAPSMEPIHIAATALFSTEFQLRVDAFLSEHCKKLSGLPESIVEVESDRLSGMPPRKLAVSEAFKSECDQRGFRDVYQNFQQLFSEGGFKDIEKNVGENSLQTACRVTLELDNFVEAMSFDASEGMFEAHDKSIIVKLLMATSDYNTFVSMLLEEQLEQEWDNEHTEGDGEGMFVKGNFMTAESQQIYVNVMEKSAAGELAPPVVSRPGGLGGLGSSRSMNRGPGPRFGD